MLSYSRLSNPGKGNVVIKDSQGLGIMSKSDFDKENGNDIKEATLEDIEDYISQNHSTINIPSLTNLTNNEMALLINKQTGLPEMGFGNDREIATGKRTINEAYRRATPEEKILAAKIAAKRERESEVEGIYNAPAAKITAGVLGAARGATFGLSDVAGKYMNELWTGVAPKDWANPNTGDELQALKEQNPYSSLAGEIVGSLPSSNYLSNVFKGTKIAQKILGKALQKSPTMLQAAQAVGRKVATSAAEGAATGTVLGAGQGISEASLGDSKGIAENLSAVAIGSLQGGLGGAITGGAVTLATEGALPLVSGVVKKGYKSAVANRLKVPEKVVDEIFAEPRKAIKFADKEYKDVIVKEIESSYKDIEGNVKKSLDDWYNESRPNAVKLYTESIDKDSVMPVFDDIITNIDTKVKELKLNENVFTNKNTITKLEKIADDFSGKSIRAKNDASTSADLYLALDDLKKDLGTLKYGIRRDAQEIESINDLYGKLKTTLEDEAIWGKPLADTQKTINHFYSEFKDASKDFDKFRIKRTEKGYAKKIIDAGKIQAVLDRQNTLKGEPAIAALERYTRSSNSLDDAIANAKATAALTKAAKSDVTSDVVSLSAFRNKLKETAEPVKFEVAAPIKERNISKLVNEQETYRDFYALGQKYDILKKAEPSESLSFEPRNLARIVGLGAASGFNDLTPTGLIKNLAGAAYVGTDYAIHHPTTVLSALAVANDIAKSKYSEFTKQAVKGVKYSPAWMDLYKKGEEDKFIEISSYGIKDALSDIPKTREKLSSAFSGIGNAAPNIAQALVDVEMNKIEFLNSKIPETQASNAFNQKRKVPSSEIAKFARYVSAVEQPFSVLEDLQHSIYNREGVEVLQQVYPTIYNDIKGKIMSDLDRIAKLPYKNRLAVSKFIGVPLEPSAARPQMTSSQPKQSQGKTRKGEIKSIEGMSTDITRLQG